MATKPEVTEPVTLRLNDAAKLLGVCPRTLWQWAEDGKIPSFRMGKVLLFPVAELREWAKRQATTKN